MTIHRLLRAMGYLLTFDARSLKTAVPFLERVMQEQLARQKNGRTR